MRLGRRRQSRLHVHEDLLIDGGLLLVVGDLGGGGGVGVVAGAAAAGPTGLGLGNAGGDGRERLLGHLLDGLVVGEGLGVDEVAGAAAAGAGVAGGCLGRLVVGCGMVVLLGFDVLGFSG
jgi:hypothetical protein